MPRGGNGEPLIILSQQLFDQSHSGSRWVEVAGGRLGRNTWKAEVGVQAEVRICYGAVLVW